MTTYTVVSELDDPIWPCIECLPKVVSDFVGEQSRVHIMPISAKWKHKSSIHIGFIVFNGGVTTFFAKSVYQFYGCKSVWLCKFNKKFYLYDMEHITLYNSMVLDDPIGVS